MSVVSENGDLVLSALEAAPSILSASRPRWRRKIFDVAADLVAKVKAAAGIPIARSARCPRRRPQPRSPPGRCGRPNVFASSCSGSPPEGSGISGCSFLGCGNLRSGRDGVTYAGGLTELYAHKLNEVSALDVVEAKEGDPVRAGQVFLAPAGRHLTFRRDGDGRVVTHLDVKPLDTLHRPAVDVLFRSAAEVFGSGVVGVVMTGMGSDGKEGAAWIKGQGGVVLTEAEETCIVYGMPRAVVEAGLSDGSVTLDRIAAALLERL
jgi:two-component system chemotaxis response regulator CheB